jgi:ABC-type branched-subunit amino acid transport system ATPase component/branched-subunit amino acid ABC-type transport system permease component
MSDVIQFFILGIASGCLISLMALGIVVIHRGSGVVNFAQGAFAMVGAYVFFELHVNLKVTFILSLLAGVAVSGLVSLLTQLLIMHPLRNAPPISRVIASLGVLGVLEQFMLHVVSPAPVFVPSDLPTSTWKIFGATVGKNQIIIAIIVFVLAAAIGAVYRYTQFGRATAASLENRRAISSLGYSPQRIAAINWLIGGALAGLAGILLAPIAELSVDQYTLLILPALAAAVVGRLDFMGLTILGGIIIGVIQSEMSFYISTPGWSDTAPFLLIIVILVIRGAQRVSRTTGAQRLPRVGTGQIRLRIVVPVLVIALALTQAGLSPFWLGAVTLTCGSAIVLLSFVIVTGYSGQLSLAQFAFAGFGLWVAGKLNESAHFPFWFALPCGVLAMLPLGVALGLICLRTSGVSLAIATLGFAVGVENLIFDSPRWTGAFGITIKSPSIFGWSINGIAHPSRYAALAVIALALASVVTANLRRGSVGRKLLASRANERAAESVGLQPTHAKVYAFGFASMVAAFGGIVIGFANTTLVFSTFSTIPSIQAVAQSLVGGVGWVAGSMIGGLGQVGGLLSQALDNFFNANIASYVPLAGAVLLIVVLIQQPDGAAAVIRQQIRPVLRRLGIHEDDTQSVVGTTTTKRGESDGQHRGPAAVSAAAAGPGAGLPAGRSARPPAGLELAVSNLRVQFGGVVAVNDVSLTVRPGEVVGLIGPNGAGKTTVIDALAGYVRYQNGTVRLGEQSLDGRKPSWRARAGLTRSFQSLELFDDMTVLDNLVTAGDPRGVGPYFTDPFYPRPRRLSPAAEAAIPEFGLAEVLNVRPIELPYGTRRLVAIARAVATGPSILLLDEPAAGLDDHETSELAELVRRLATDWGMGVLLVEHDVAMVMGLCDRVYAMDVGKVIASGPPAEVRRDEGVISAYLGVATDVVA